jgi:hypothetical protein
MDTLSINSLKCLGNSPPIKGISLEIGFCI